MVYRAFVSVVVALVSLSFTSRLLAQADPVKAAEEEAVRRQETIIVLKQTLGRAKAAELKKDFKTAAPLYEECIKLGEKLGGVNVETEQSQARVGLTNSRMALSKAAFEARLWDDADKEVQLLLNFIPDSVAGHNYKNYIYETRMGFQGREPSKATLGRITEVLNGQKEVSTLVQDGKLLYEMRLYDDAEVKLREAIKLDPASQPAYYYLSLIQEAHFADEARQRDEMQRRRVLEVEKSWKIPNKSEQLPMPNEYVRTNTVNNSTKSRQAILRKMGQINFKTLGPFDGLPLSEVVKFLYEECQKLDPEKKGLNFIINPYLEDAPTISAAAAAAGAIDPFGSGGSGPGGPLGGAALAPPLLGPDGLPLAPGAAAPAANRIDLGNVIITINPPLSDMSLTYALDAITKAGDQRIKFIVEDYAIVFTAASQTGPQLFTRTFKVDPQVFVQGLQAVSAFSFSGPSSGSSGGGGQGGGGQGGGGQGGQGSGSGVLSFPRVDVSGGGGLGGGQGGQGGGQGGGRGGGGGGGGAQGGGQGGGAQGGGQGGGSGGGLEFVTQTNNTSIISAMVRQYFIAAGVNLNTNIAGQSTMVFYNDRTGVLMVRATLQDLENIQQAIEVLSIAPQQVSIESKFAEVTQRDTKGLGFDWALGNVLLGGGRAIASAGTQPSFQGAATAANPIGTFPGIPGINQGQGGNNNNNNQNNTGTLIAPASTDGLLTAGLRNQVGLTSAGALPSLFSLTGILTDPQFRMVIKALDQRDGVDVLSAPRVTTLSGRQAHVEVTDLATIVTGVNAGQTGAGGGGGGGGGFGNSASGVGSFAIPGTQTIPLGPVLDVLPYVSSDGFSVQMTLIPTFVEFIGYDDPGPFVPQVQSVSGTSIGVPLTTVLPLPRSRLRQVVTSCVVWDGQTIMLGGLISEDVRNLKDKVPIFGDLPLFGRFFRSESKSTFKKNLIIFVTPTIIDPAGNRVHRDEELPFTSNPVPGKAWPVRDRNFRTGW